MKVMQDRKWRCNIIQEMQNDGWVPFIRYPKNIDTVNYYVNKLVILIDWYYFEWIFMEVLEFFLTAGMDWNAS